MHDQHNTQTSYQPYLAFYFIFRFKDGKKKRRRLANASDCLKDVKHVYSFSTWKVNIKKIYIFGRWGLNNYRTAMLNHSLETSWCQLLDDNSTFINVRKKGKMKRYSASAFWEIKRIKITISQYYCWNTYKSNFYNIY